jgi:hypothetical protein
VTVQTFNPPYPAHALRTSASDPRAHAVNAVQSQAPAHWRSRAVDPNPHRPGPGGPDRGRRGIGFALHCSLCTVHKFKTSPTSAGVRSIRTRIGAAQEDPTGGRPADPRHNPLWRCVKQPAAGVDTHPRGIGSEGPNQGRPLSSVNPPRDAMQQSAHGARTTRAGQAAGGPDGPAPDTRDHQLASPTQRPARAALQLKVRKVRKCGKLGFMRVSGRCPVRDAVRKCGKAGRRLSAGVRTD